MLKFLVQYLHPFVFTAPLLHVEILTVETWGPGL